MTEHKYEASLHLVHLCPWIAHKNNLVGRPRKFKAPEAGSAAPETDRAAWNIPPPSALHAPPHATAPSRRAPLPPLIGGIRILHYLFAAGGLGVSDLGFRGLGGLAREGLIATAQRRIPHRRRALPPSPARRTWTKRGKARSNSMFGASTKCDKHGLAIL